MTNILEIVEGLKITSNRIEDGANEVSIIHGEKEDFIILDHAATRRSTVCGEWQE